MNFKGKRILVTGGCGFIASHLVKRLLEEGAEVSIIIRGRKSCETRNIFNLSRVEILDTSLLDNSTRLTAELQRVKPSIVFHLAFPPRTRVDEFDRWFLQTQNLVKSLVQAGIESRLLYVGSGAEYGKVNPPFREDDPAKPEDDPYGQMKLRGTRRVIEAYRKDGLDAVIVRPSVVYGPGQSSEWNMLIPNVVGACMKIWENKLVSEQNKGDFIFVDDLVEGILLVVNNCEAGTIVNLGSGTLTRVKFVADFIKQLFEPPMQIELQSENGGHLDIQRAKKLGWNPETDIKDGLKKTVEWYKNNPEILSSFAS